MAAQLKVVSSAFEQGASIPKRFTCEGEDESPPLAWSGVAAGARSLALAAAVVLVGSVSC